MRSILQIIPQLHPFSVLAKNSSYWSEKSSERALWKSFRDAINLSDKSDDRDGVISAQFPLSRGGEFRAVHFRTVLSREVRFRTVNFRAD